ncbi:hypothetical protein BBP40_011820 [Aspergillus hancockii]|nr:hypothetical protein BBP40_011820 [Aspergillus hancockii]
MASESPLLRLPREVRGRIYHWAPVIHSGYFNIDVITQSRMLEEQRRTTHALLLTCGTIYLEVSAIVYGTNKLHVTYQDESSLQFLRNLTPRSLSHIKALTVFLAIFPPEDESHCHESCGCWHGPLPSVWTLEGKEGEDVLADWETTVDYIAQHIKPSTVQFNFICDLDVGDMETVEQVLCTLGRLPTLLDCNIRLGCEIEPELEALARSTAFKLMGQEEPSSDLAFPFMDLPVELRLQVLEHTDLVTPLREVEWNPTDNFYLRFCDRQCVCCGCPVQKPHRNCWQHVKSGCFCHRYHAAYTKHCNCWAPPTALFLVCRTLLHEVQNVFFSQNRFIVMPPGGDLNDMDRCTYTKLPAAEFLSEIMPSHALKYLRFLEIHFSPYDVDGICTENAAYKNWECVLRELGTSLNYVNLTVRIYFGDFLNELEGQAARGNSEEDGEEIMSKYVSLLKPFIHFRQQGLRRFFVHAAWPWNWTPFGYAKRMRRPELVYHRTQQINEKLERWVMGNCYDSTTVGKHEVKWSQWRESLDNMLTFDGIFVFD